MLSALIPPVGRKPAVPLAGQLAHESFVRPGPLVLGTAFLKSPTAASDRDRHSCYHRRIRSGARAFLPGSACRHADRTISSRLACLRGLLGIWSLRILDSELSVQPSIPTTTVHLKCFGGKPLETFRYKMFTASHRSHDVGERGELLSVCSSVADFVRRRGSLFSRRSCRRRTTITNVWSFEPAMVLTQRSTAQELLEQGLRP